MLSSAAKKREQQQQQQQSTTRPATQHHRRRTDNKYVSEQKTSHDDLADNSTLSSQPANSTAPSKPVLFSAPLHFPSTTESRPEQRRLTSLINWTRWYQAWKKSKREMVDHNAGSKRN